MQKLKGINRKTHDYAVKHDRRPFIFSVTTEDGGTMELQHSVAKEDVAELVRMFREAYDLARGTKSEPKQES